jgi:hypothetical protein
MILRSATPISLFDPVNSVDKVLILGRPSSAPIGIRLAAFQQEFLANRQNVFA